MLLDSLNPKQKEAVLKTEGPLLILAGAGSGKTRVLTTRVAYIMRTKKIQPNNILTVTFTNKAANEMKERIKNILGLEGSTKDWKFLPYCGTFHSICSKILRKTIPAIGFKSNFTIYDETDRKSAIKKAMEKIGLNKKEWRPQSIGSAISKAKNVLITPEKYLERADDYYTETIGNIFIEYEKILKDNHALDFDDLIGRMIEVFKKDKNILDKYQNLFKYILVDEYQDTNHAQYTLIKMLSEKNKNICVVGDDAQSIYRFRMADIKNILNFEKDFKNAHLIYLDQGYRNTKNILNAANTLIRNNKKQKEKELWTKNSTGEKIQIYLAEDEIDEASFIIKRIKDLKQEDPSLRFKDFTILYRANAQSRAIEAEMLKQSMPYKIVGGVKYYDRKEIKDILAYMALLINPDDLVRLERIINVPARGIGTKTYQKIINSLQKNRMNIIELLESGLYQQEINRQTLSLKAFGRFLWQGQELISKKNTKISEVLDFVLKKSGYLEMLEKDKESTRIENLKELFTVIKKFDNLPVLNAIESFLEEISLVSAQDDIKEEDVVNLMTVHASKGLEFKNVFIVGMEEGLFPHSQSAMDPNDLEEERRLCYVAVTRAIDRVFLIHAESRKLYGNTQINLPSRFLEEFPKEVIKKESYQNISDREDINSNFIVIDENIDDDEIQYLPEI